MIPSEPVVKSIIGDFELRIRSILEGAWDDWLEEPKKGIKSSRSRASIVFDFIKHRALTEFDGDPNIRAIPRGQTIQFLFKDQVLVRFKKANSAGIGSNIETAAVLRFVDPQLSIPDLLPEVLRIEICYHLDALGTKLETLAVAARDRRRRIWGYELARPSIAEVLPFTPRPSSPPPSSGIEVRPRVQPRVSETDSDKE